MKRFYTVFILVLLWCGCMNINEDINLNADGSGIYSEEIDLSSMLAFISATASMDSSSGSSSPGSFMPDMDSSFSMKEYADTATSLTAEEKKLVQNASVRMISNQADTVFKIKLTFPFSTMQQLEQLMAMVTGKSSMNLAMKSSGMDKGMPEDDDTKMPDLTSVYTTTCSKGTIDKKMDEAKWKSMQQDEQIIQLQQSGDMMKAYLFTTTIHLPKPAKKLTGDKAVLSTDKKTVTISGNMADMANDPKAFTYHIEY